jgi:hypothetical protein
MSHRATVIRLICSLALVGGRIAVALSVFAAVGAKPQAQRRAK